MVLGESTAPPISEDDAYRLVSSNEPPMPPAPPVPVATEIAEESIPPLMPQAADETADTIPLSTAPTDAPAVEAAKEKIGFTSPRGNRCR